MTGNPAISLLEYYVVQYLFRALVVLRGEVLCPLWYFVVRFAFREELALNSLRDFPRRRAVLISGTFFPRCFHYSTKVNKKQTKFKAVVTVYSVNERGRSSLAS